MGIRWECVGNFGPWAHGGGFILKTLQYIIPYVRQMGGSSEVSQHFMVITIFQADD